MRLLEKIINIDEECSDMDERKLSEIENKMKLKNSGDSNGK